MWKVLLLLACVASFTIVYCDDNANSSNDDFDDDDTSFRAIKSSSKKSQSSSSSSSSQFSSSTLQTSALKSLKSSKSSSSQSASSSSESSSTKITDYTSKKRQTLDSNDDSNSSSNDASGSVDVDTTAQGSTDANASDNSLPQNCDDDSDTTRTNAPSYKCGKNQVFSNCTNGGCDARFCSQAGKPVPCVKLDPKNCIKGCVCQSGYLRTKKGNCVLKDQCNEGCGNDPNAHPGCGVNCGKTCEKRRICPRICKPNGCDCNDGYFFDSNVGKCVLQKECTPVCGLNEVYSSCINGGCGYKNCSQIGQPKLCVDPAPGYCIKGCVCASGYLRAANGTCVPQDQCPRTGCNGDPNAHPGCGVNCGRTCATYKTKNVACPAICNLNGCDCNEGYVYDDKAKKCVRPENCIGCGGDPNAEPGCGYNCGRTCSSYKINRQLLCPRIQCKPDKCDCKDGYVLDKNVNKCVLIKDCTPTCGRNEVYSSCTNGGCGHRNCSQVGQPQICIDRTPESCTKGCICAGGYLRAANGTCIPQDQCPPTSCNGDPNAHPGCGVNCGRTCQTYKTKPVACPLICNLNGCDCNDGYVFDKFVNKCVLPKDCTKEEKCDKPNEVYDVCPAPCPPRRCDVDDRIIRCAAPPKPGDPKCQPGCRCADGYARNATGTCVLRDQCEQPLTCDGANEVYESCPAPCPGDSCDVNPALVLCAPGPSYGDPACKPACRCIDGYARNANNECIPRDQCPPPSNDQCPRQNEFFDTCISGCSNQSCAVIGKKFNCPIQPAVCRTGCRCKPGFYRNADNVCVPKSECPPPTNDQCLGQNEFFDTCISGCSNQSCAVIGKKFNCPIQPAVCRTGCRCKPGFYRNSDNDCVSESECPTPACPEGEVYSRCPAVKCDAEYCPKTRNSPLTCPIGIVCDPPRCICGFNSHRDRKTGKCIATADCPPFKCDGPNEVYKSCPAPCPGENCTDYINSSRCPPFRIGIVVPCKPQCKCIDGYYRNSDGVCILGSECGPKATTQAPVIITTVPPTTTTEIDNNGGDSGNALANLQDGVTSFNGKFLYDRMKADKGQNIIASPYSVLTPMAQLCLYASGDSLKQLLSLLNVSSKQSIRSSFRKFTSSLDGQTSVNFTTAAKIYSDKKYPLSDSFKNDSKYVVGADAQEVDFSQNTQAAQIINAWVESKTNNRIKDLIKPSDLSALTRLVLVNAIYFKGEWQNSFKKENTKEADFYLSDGTTKKTKLMYQQATFNYGEVPDLNVTALEMFYKGRNFSMVIVLPNEKDGVYQTAKNMQSPANFKKVIGSLRSQIVKVYLPPFEINTQTDLSEILKQAGVTKIFDSKDSGLTGLLETPEDTYVSKAIQKAFIKVDEKGSEAAAANGGVVGRPRPGPPPPPPVEFRADHAFLYYIRVQSITMFCGAFVQ